MPHLARRLFAGFVDGVLALVLTGLFFSALLIFVPLGQWQGANPVPLCWALAFVFLALLRNGDTPGKRWARLSLVGHGCLACRELRRMGWAIILGCAALLEPFLSSGALVGLQATSVLIFAASYLVPAIMHAADFSHNSATGFSVQRLHNEA